MTITSHRDGAGKPSKADRLDDPSALELADEPDREELRRRYYGLLQELRVLLPGVQVLVAFLLTVPFAERFSELDDVGKDMYLTSLVAGVLAVVAFVTPTAFHRFGDRRSRSQRLAWAIRMTRLGIVFMAIALESAIFVICRLVFDTTLAFVVVGSVGVVMVSAWIVLPLAAGRGSHRDERDHG
jgi:hypothetical protein